MGLNELFAPVRRTVIMSKKLATFLLGLAFPFLLQLCPLDLFVTALRAAALNIPNIWLAASFFYLIPLAAAYLIARAACRWWILGVCLIQGWVACELCLALLNLDALLRSGVASRCGTCGLGWLTATSFLPSALGKLMVLARDDQKKRLAHAQQISITQPLHDLAPMRLNHKSLLPLERGRTRQGEPASQALKVSAYPSAYGRARRFSNFSRAACLPFLKTPETGEIMSPTPDQERLDVFLRDLGQAADSSGDLGPLKLDEQDQVTFIDKIASSYLSGALPVLGIAVAAYLTTGVSHEPLLVVAVVLMAILTAWLFAPLARGDEGGWRRDSPRTGNRGHLTMKTSSIESTTSGNCELCAGPGPFAVYEVPPADRAAADTEVCLCDRCLRQVDKKEPLDSQHWRCLTDSMWSDVPAVQVLAWRLLQRLRGESWAAENLDVLYLSDELLDWAKASGDHDSDGEVELHQDCNGNPLENGDSVVLIKSLDVKGSTLNARMGTTVKNIRLVPNNTGQIEGRIEGQLIVILTKYVRKQSQV